MKYPQYVYVLLAERSGMLKVGYAADPGRRLAELQTGSPEELILMGYLPGGPELEQHIHNLLRVEHVHGEWFRATDDVLATLRTLLATQGTLRSVQDELERRHNALHGLRGLRVYLKGQGTTLWTILDSRWGSRNRLFLVVCPQEPTGDADRDDDTEPEGVELIAANLCLLASSWPMVCDCGLPERMIQQNKDRNPG